MLGKHSITMRYPIRISEILIQFPHPPFPDLFQNNVLLVPAWRGWGGGPPQAPDNLEDKALGSEPVPTA